MCADKGKTQRLIGIVTSLEIGRSDQKLAILGAGQRVWVGFKALDLLENTPERG